MDFEVWTPSCGRERLWDFKNAVDAQGRKGKLVMSVTGYGPLLRDYVYFLLAKLAFHRQHPEFNGLVSLQSASTVGAKKPYRTL